MSETTIPTPQLNRIKENISLAYMYSLNALVNYAVQPANRAFDDEGIDMTVINRLLGSNRTVASDAHTIHMQLKAVSITSKTMIEEDNSSITYTLKRDLVPIDTFFLVVVVLPGEDVIDTWRECTPEMIILRKCAYFLHVPTTLRAGKIKIPKTNILNPDSFMKLFEVANRKDVV